MLYRRGRHHSNYSLYVCIAHMLISTFSLRGQPVVLYSHTASRRPFLSSARSCRSSAGFESSLEHASVILQGCYRPAELYRATFLSRQRAASQFALVLKILAENCSMLSFRSSAGRSTTAASQQERLYHAVVTKMCREAESAAQTWTLSQSRRPPTLPGSSSRSANDHYRSGTTVHSLFPVDRAFPLSALHRTVCTAN